MPRALVTGVGCRQSASGQKRPLRNRRAIGRNGVGTRQLRKPILAPQNLPHTPSIFTAEPVMTSDDREGSQGWEVASIGRGELGSCACDTAYLARTRENPGVVAGQWPHFL